jgi:hypothetical protein
MSRLVYILFVLVGTSVSQAKEIYFEIPENTADMLVDWNSSEEPVMAEVGDVLLIKNLDNQPHQLHTSGNRPCGHGDRINPGETWSCTLINEYNAFEEEQPTRDHFNYDLKFWIIVLPKK